MELLARRGGPVDEERGRLRDALGDSPAVRDLVRCLVVPYCALLSSEPGRSYLRIVAQLRGRFAAWRVESDEATTKHLARVLGEIEDRPSLPAPVRRERVVALIMVLTATAAERARRIDEGVMIEAGSDLDDDEFVENLIDMCTALIVA